MIRNIRKLFCQKLKFRKSNFLQDPGYVEGVTKVHAACNLQELPHVEGVERNKKTY